MAVEGHSFHTGGLSHFCDKMAFASCFMRPQPAAESEFIVFADSPFRPSPVKAHVLRKRAELKLLMPFKEGFYLSLVFVGVEGAGGIYYISSLAYGRSASFKYIPLGGQATVYHIFPPSLDDVRILSKHSFSAAGSVYYYLVKKRGERRGDPVGRFVQHHRVSKAEKLYIL